MEHRSSPPSFAWVVLSSALAAAFLNLASALLGHPRALESAARLGLPLAAALGVLLPVAALLLGLGRWLASRVGLGRGALEVALAAAFVLASALAPLVEVGLRETSAERALVVLTCAGGFVLCAAFAVYGRAARVGAEASWPQIAFVLAPPAALLVLWSAWGLEYKTASLAGRTCLVAAGGVGLLGAVLVARRFPRAVLGAVGALVLAHAALDASALRSPAVGVGSAADPRPPVVLITVDTLRADRLSPGPTRVPTPAIDALAADSVVFTQARSAAPWTKPSLASLLTGLSPLVHGMTTRRARLPEEVETLAERLAARGYRTAGIGLNAHLERAFRFDQGFDDYRFPARLDYGIALGARVLERLAPARYPELFPSTTAIADEALAWLAGSAREPFFLWLHMLDPHWPYEPPPAWVEEPAREPRRWGEPAMVTAVQAGNTKPGAAERERVAQLYAGEIRYVDAELERVLTTLKAMGLYERALIVFASDHGEEFWEHGHYEHGHTLYDEVLRVPLAFKLPGAGVRASLDAPVSSEALVPTVLDVLGLPHDSAQLSARSLAPFWQDRAGARSEPLFAGGTYYFGEKRAVVFDGWKLVLELDTGRVELFDLAADPGELHSLAAARSETTAAGLALLRGWEERCAELRKLLGLPADSSAEAGAEVLRMLQGLGYN